MKQASSALLLSIGILLAGCASEKPPENAATPAMKASEPAKTEAKPVDQSQVGSPQTPHAVTTSSTAAPTGAQKATITKSEFDQIENGMTFEEVTSVIGGEGEMLAEAGTKGEASHTVVYMYEGEGGVGSNATFTFLGGKLQVKAQMGLQ